MAKPKIHNIRMIENASHFDGDWYTNRYPDVTASGLKPAEHYIRFGAILGRNPSSNFDSLFYTESRALKLGQNPLLHQMNAAANGQDSPKPWSVLFAAANAGKRRGWDYALELAHCHLNKEYEHTFHVLNANYALSSGDIDGWLTGLNGFLAHWKVGPLTIQVGSGPLIGRLRTKPLPTVNDGPKVSILMPAWNAEDTIAISVGSILSQTWRNLELIVVDDCSSDSTWSMLQNLAAQDERLRIHRNPVNVGPYVSKNVALMMASGVWITGHDADDLAVSDRIERQIRFATRNSRSDPASLTYMVRLSPEGSFSVITRVNPFSVDGVARLAPVSCLFDATFLREKMGFWDSVRFGADSEMIERVQHVIGHNISCDKYVSMICLDAPTSLTNHPEHGVGKGAGISPARAAYRASWVARYKDRDILSVKLPFIQHRRQHSVHFDMIVPQNYVIMAKNAILEKL